MEGNLVYTVFALKTINNWLAVTWAVYVNSHIIRCTSTLLDQMALVLIVTNDDLIWTIGISYVVHVRGYSGYTPCTLTSHVHVLWSARYCTSLSTIIDEDEMWQGIKSAWESNVIGNQMWHCVHHSVACDSRGMAMDVMDLDYCLPRVHLEVRLFKPRLGEHL